MSEENKDQWILNQATILYASQRESFMETLKNNKMLMNMPSEDEFKGFCNDVKSGNKYIEYETWYEEFDDYGYYHDDWEQKFYDSCGVIEFIDNIFEVCKNLNKLGYYDLTCKYMESLNDLEIEIRETMDSEGSYEGTSPFTINVAYEHFLPYHKKGQVAYHWIYAYCHRELVLSIEEKANQLLKLFLEPLCNKVLFSDFDCINKEMIEMIFCQLQQLLDNHTILYNKYSEASYSNEKYDLMSKIERETQLLEDLKSIL
ncbi:MAG: hypothetical protein LUG60_08480 [Erysipelotrichaceae bacterium]|nr:hypothetical protein [Erysipelotrichaceae bacterium]